jgi:hypothetical protein
VRNEQDKLRRTRGKLTHNQDRLRIALGNRKIKEGIQVIKRQEPGGMRA